MKMDTSEIRLEILVMLWNLVLEKDGEYQLDRLRENCGSVTESQAGEEIPINNTKKEG